MYDTDEVNRIPTTKARRPAKDGDEDKVGRGVHPTARFRRALTSGGCCCAAQYFPPPRTGLNVMYHQTPFRVLDESEIAFHLWTDMDSGVATRLVKSIEQACARPVLVWQVAVDHKTRQPYWWNFETRETRKDPPSSVRWRGRPGVWTNFATTPGSG
jgi:hypothetical protein